MKRKKILYIITKSNWGGAQRYVYDLATNIPHDQYDTAVALGGNGELAQKLGVAGVRVINIPSLKRNISLLSETAVFFSLLKLLVNERPDIIHVNSSKIGGLGAFVGRLVFIPHIIFTAHGWAFNEERSWLSRKLITLLHWLTIIFTHKTIVVSKALKHDIDHLPFMRGKLVVIQNGIVPHSYIPRQEAREKLIEALPPQAKDKARNWKTPCVGTIAELHKSKGLSYALQAWARVLEKHPGAQYFIISEGEERARLERQIKELGLEDSVFLLGFVRDAAIYLKAFDAFLLPSITEALGFVLLEAGGAGLPTIASRVGGIPEVITDKQTGILFEPRNVNQIASAINHILDNPNEGKRLGEMLHKHVRDAFSLEQMLSKTLRAYGSGT